MAADLQVRRLLNFETATDGSAVRLIVEDIGSQRVGIVFTVETVTALLMTLPKISIMPDRTNAIHFERYQPSTGQRVYVP